MYIFVSNNDYFIDIEYTFYRYGKHIFVIATQSNYFSRVSAKEKSDKIELIRNKEVYISGLQVKLKDTYKNKRTSV